MKRVALATVILGAVALNAAAQQAIRVSGRVVADQTGDPLVNARVVLTSPSQGSSVLTDRDPIGSTRSAARSPTITRVRRRGRT